MLWIVFFGLLAVLAALPILAERRRYAVTEAQRRAAPGGTAVLSGGKTHYRWFGSDGQPVMVLIHGLTGASFIWEGLAPRLAGNGARVLVYDVFGRGLSDRPGTAQTRAFFIRQLRELLQDQGIEGDITLVGYSMGGSIATVFAAEEAERVERLILIAPSGLARTARPAAEFCRRTFWLGDWAMTVFGGMALRREPVAAPSTVPDLAARMANETRMRGYLQSVLSSMRNLLAERLDEDHAEVKRMYVPTLAIWGEQDQTIPIQALGELARANRDARQVTLPAAGHGLVHTHPKEINQAIQGFLKEL